MIRFNPWHWGLGGKLLLAVIGLLGGIALYAFGIEPNRLVVRETTIKLPNWPVSLRGLRIATFSDLHAGAPFMSQDKIRRIVATTNATNPDIILLAGDFVIQDVMGGTFMEPEILAGELKNLRARLGVYATLGNHDWWYNAPRVMQALETAGVQVLENKAVKVGENDTSFWVAGLADLWEGKPDIPNTLKQVTDEEPVIAFTHNPDLFPHLPSRVALLIAGHTHGGQVFLPLAGRPVVPSQYGQRYAQGHIIENGNHLFVTSGIGTSILPLRFRVPPEISVLKIE